MILAICLASPNRVVLKKTRHGGRRKSHKDLRRRQAGRPLCLFRPLNMQPISLHDRETMVVVDLG